MIGWIIIAFIAGFLIGAIIMSCLATSDKIEKRK